MRYMRVYIIVGMATALILSSMTARAEDPVPPINLPTDVSAATDEQKPSEDRAEKERSFDNSRTDITLYNKTVSNPNRVKSVFYTETEIKDIHLAVNTYLKNIGRGGDLTFDEEAFLSRLGGLKNVGNTQNSQSRFFTYPQFFLNSLVYYTANNWIVWLNGEKITQETPQENSNVHITGITSDKVTVEWFPLEMKRVMEIWKLFPNKQVTVDSMHGRVIFDLKPNQTFSSYTMTTLEGKVLPMTVDVTKSVVPFTFEDMEETKSPTEEVIPSKKVISEE